MKIIIILFLVISSMLGKNKDVTLQLKWKHQFQFAGYYAALHKGYYEEEGLNVTIKEAFNNMDIVDEVLSNNAQFGIGTSELILDFAKNKPISIIGVIFQHSPLAIMSLNKNIKTIHDLAGKNIMIESGSADIYTLLKRENIDINSLKILPHTFNVQSLIENKVDAMSVYSIDEPYYLQQKELRYNIFSPREAGIDFYGDNLFTSQDMINLNPDIVEKFKRASFKGWKYAMSNQNEIIEIIMNNYNTQNKTKDYYNFEAMKMAELIYPEILEIGYMQEGRWEHIISIYKELGFLNKNIELEKFLYYPSKNLFEEYKYTIFFILFLLVILLIIGYIAYYIHKINQKLVKSEQKHKIIFQNSPTAALVWKKGYIITNWNEQATKMFGWTENEVIGKSFVDFFIPESEKSNISRYINNFFKNDELHIFTNENIMKNGNSISCEWYNIRIPNFEEDDEFEVISLLIDITRRVENEEILNRLANYDSLTNLPNKNYFETILEKKYFLSKRNNIILGLAFIDVDNFKSINDTYGHYMGDFLLQELSKRFQNYIRKEDTIARVGGDEFAFAFHISNEKENYESFLNKLLQVASKPIEYTDEIQLKITISIGVSFYSSKNFVSIKELIKQADSAMYEAKRKGKNLFCTYKNN